MDQLLSSQPLEDASTEQHSRRMPALRARPEKGTSHVDSAVLSSRASPQAPARLRQLSDEPAAQAGPDGRKRTRQAAVATVEVIFVDLPTAAAILSLSESSVQRLIVDGELSPPRDLSKNRVGYLLSELRDWASNRPVSQKLPPPNTGGRRRKDADSS
jgi:prophage regulatory protein